MTFRERLEIEHPEYVDDEYMGGCKDCPEDYGYREASYTEDVCSECDCEVCWNMECPTTISTRTINLLKNEIAKRDMVNNPSHYTNGGMECIDEMILIFGKTTVANFCLCNAWKFRYRALYKNGEEDMKKSHWYIAKYKELVEDEWTKLEF